jgi:hypothetical protein
MDIRHLLLEITFYNSCTGLSDPVQFLFSLAAHHYDVLKAV